MWQYDFYICFEVQLLLRPHVCFFKGLTSIPPRIQALWAGKYNWLTLFDFEIVILCVSLTVVSISSGSV